MNMCLIYKLILLILVFILLIVYDKHKEGFVMDVGNRRLKHDRQGYLGSFSVVNVGDDPDAYDIEKNGPLCVGKCIAEHGPNILFTNPSGSTNPLDWNNENPTKGFCYRANSNSYPFECDKDCQSKCGTNTNDTSQSQNEYNPDIDFSQCTVDHDKGGCVEKKLNMLTGQSCMTTVGCKLCIEKYMGNLNQLKNVFFEEILESDRCDADAEAEAEEEGDTE